MKPIKIEVSESEKDQGYQEFEIEKNLKSLTTDRLEQALKDQLEWVGELRAVFDRLREANEKVLRQSENYAFPETSIEDYDVEREKATW